MVTKDGFGAYHPAEPRVLSGSFLSSGMPLGRERAEPGSLEIPQHARLGVLSVELADLGVGTTRLKLRLSSDPQGNHPLLADTTLDVVHGVGSTALGSVCLSLADAHVVYCSGESRVYLNVCIASGASASLVRARLAWRKI